MLARNMGKLILAVEIWIWDMLDCVAGTEVEHASYGRPFELSSQTILFRLIQTTLFFRNYRRVCQLIWIVLWILLAWCWWHLIFLKMLVMGCPLLLLLHAMMQKFELFKVWLIVFRSSRVLIILRGPRNLNICGRTPQTPLAIYLIFGRDLDLRWTHDLGFLNLWNDQCVFLLIQKSSFIDVNLGKP